MKGIILGLGRTRTIGLTKKVGPILFIGDGLMIDVSHLKTKRIRRGYIVINTKTGEHTHMRSKYGCYLIKMFIRKNIYPDNPYLQESYKRLTEGKK